MIRTERIKTWLLIAVLTICGTASFASCTSKEDNATGQGKVAEIVERGTILFGTTGDYRPLSFCEPDGTYWGFGIEVAEEIAKNGCVSGMLRMELAQEAFKHTSEYDDCIQNYLMEQVNK